MAIGLEQLAAEDFETLLGRKLAAESGEARFELEVERVERSPYPSTRAQAPFSVFLRSPPQWQLGQGMVRLHHPVHGELDLFMTIIGRDALGGRHEILFN